MSVALVAIGGISLVILAGFPAVLAGLAAAIVTLVVRPDRVDDRHALVGFLVARVYFAVAVDWCRRVVFSQRMCAPQPHAASTVAPQEARGNQICFEKG
jgi:hypothetical protein